MYLHRIYLNLRCKEARRDIADPYEMHSTLCRAFTTPEVKCPQSAFLWRHEPEQNVAGMPKIIVQSHELPNWGEIKLPEWFWEQPSSPLDLAEKLAIKKMQNGRRFRYRLRANPSICRNGKRFGLFDVADQINWLHRQGVKNGFRALTIHRSEEKMLSGKIRGGYPIKVFSVLYDGIVEVTDMICFSRALSNGIGHAKAMGLGLLSVMPANKFEKIRI